VALLALSDGEVVGCASHITTGERVPGRQSGAAEIAFAVVDHMHHRGIATLLLEHQHRAGTSLTSLISGPGKPARWHTNSSARHLPGLAFPGQTTDLLGCYGILLADAEDARDRRRARGRHRGDHQGRG
jgi:hypothetical protein